MLFIVSIQKSFRPLLQADRTMFLDQMAGDDSVAMDKGDARQGFAILRAFVGKSVKANPWATLVA